jgi:hypothetical protein
MTCNCDPGYIGPEEIGKCWNRQCGWDVCVSPFLRKSPSFGFCAYELLEIQGPGMIMAYKQHERVGDVNGTRLAKLHRAMGALLGGNTSTWENKTEVVAGSEPVLIYLPADVHAAQGEQREQRVVRENCMMKPAWKVAQEKQLKEMKPD